MWFDMRRVELDFIDTADKTCVMEVEVSATRQQVWVAITDPCTWKHWFPGVISASYGGETPPYGVGIFREASVTGGKFEETILAWDEGERLAYRIDRATVPIAHAQVESTELEDTPRGTRVRWVLATDRRLLLWLATPILQWHLDRLWKKAMTNLEGYLSHSVVQRSLPD